MITLPQIKAARALIDWNQKDLAKSSGLSLSTIAQIERGAVTPRSDTLRILQQTFEKNDVEFLDDPGVKIRQEPFSVVLWRGKEAILKVWQDIAETFADGTGGQVLLSNLDDAAWEKIYAKELPREVERRARLKIETLALVGAAKDNHTMPAASCRVIPKTAVTAETPYYVYGDKVAIMKIRPPVRVVLMRNPLLAESFRAQFLFHWENGKKA